MRENSLDFEETPKTSLLWLWLSLLIIVLDQITKFYASTYLVFRQATPIFEGFNLTLLHNQGAAFSFLADAGGWQRWLFTGLAIVIGMLIIVWLSRLNREQRWLACALALVLGGAIGNLIDRVLYGYVIDFIDVYYQQWHYPAFNIADSAITIGAVMLLIDAFGNNHLH